MGIVVTLMLQIQICFSILSVDQVTLGGITARSAVILLDQLFCVERGTVAGYGNSTANPVFPSPFTSASWISFSWICFT